MRKTIVFVDHSFHKKTGSGNFLRDLFKEEYKIIDLYDESWKGIDNLDAECINKYNPDIVFFFQSILGFEQLKKIKAKVVWAPMYDSVISFQSIFWRELSKLPILIVSFCKCLHKKVRYYGLSSLYIQYYLDPSKLPKSTKNGNRKVFFWQRTNISFKDIKRYFRTDSIDGVIFKSDADPNHKVMPPNDNEIKDYKIQLLIGSFEKKVYLNNVNRCGLFVSPREYEGIGMSFLEAMAMGIVVVAIDNPTMNEYIKDGYNGYLISLTSSRKINFDKLESVRKNLILGYNNGFKLWEGNKHKIIDFIENELPNVKVISKKSMLIYKIISGIESVIYYVNRAIYLFRKKIYFFLFSLL